MAEKWDGRGLDGPDLAKNVTGLGCSWSIDDELSIRRCQDGLSRACVIVFSVLSCLLGRGDHRNWCYLRFTDILTRERVLAVREVERQRSIILRRLHELLL